MNKEINEVLSGNGPNLSLSLPILYCSEEYDEELVEH